MRLHAIFLGIMCALGIVVELLAIYRGAPANGPTIMALATCLYLLTERHE